MQTQTYGLGAGILPSLTSAWNTAGSLLNKALAPAQSVANTTCGVVSNPYATALAQGAGVPASATAAALAACGALAPRGTATLPANAVGISTSITPPVMATAGMITAYSAKRGMWRIARPRGLSGFGASFSPLHPLEYVETASSPVAPTGATQVSETELERKTGQLPWYKDWHYLVPIGAGVAAAGVGGYFLIRKKRR
jgi:hypothetical protein